MEGHKFTQFDAPLPTFVQKAMIEPVLGTDRMAREPNAPLKRALTR
jgi:hypothetical protein